MRSHGARGATRAVEVDLEDRTAPHADPRARRSAVGELDAGASAGTRAVSSPSANQAKTLPLAGRKSRGRSVDRVGSSKNSNWDTSPVQSDTQPMPHPVLRLHDEAPQPGLEHRRMGFDTDRDA